MDIKQRLKDYRFYSKKNYMDRAGIIINELCELYPNDPYVLFEYAIYLYKTGPKVRKKKAILILKDLIDNDAPNKLDCCFEFIRCAMFTNMYNEYIERYYNILAENNYMLDKASYIMGREYEKRGLKTLAIEHYKKASELGFEKASKRLRDFELSNNLFDDSTLEAITSSENNNLFELDNRIELLRKQAKYTDIRIALHNYEDKYTTFHNKNTVGYIFNTYCDIGYFNDALNVYEKNKKILDEDFKMYLDAKIDLINYNYKDAEIKFNELIKNNSEYKPSSYFYLAKLANYNKKYKLEEYYYNCIGDIKEYKNDSYWKKVCLYLRQNKTKEALDCLKKISKSYIRVHQHQFNQIYAMLDIDIYDYYNDNYTIKQIKNYDFSLALDHIKRHTVESDYYKSRIVFDSHIKIDELANDIITELDEDTLKYCDIFNHYIVEYEGAGRNDEIEANYIEVITLLNSKNIITMFPVTSDNVFSSCKIDKEPKKIKRKSQIEKFNERYTKKVN